MLRKLGIIGTFLAGGAVTGALLLTMGQAKPGEFISRDREEWTLTDQEAVDYLGAMAFTKMSGIVVDRIEELSCRNVSHDDYSWTCSAHVQRVRAITTIDSLKASGKTFTILDFKAAE